MKPHPLFQSAAELQEGRQPRCERRSRLVLLAFAAIVLICGGSPCRAQSREPSILHVQRNEVLVRVVVRDSNGRPEANLGKENFRLYDNGQLQSINGFEVQRPTKQTQTGPQAVSSATIHQGERQQAHRRSLALYFDDLDLQMGDLAQTRAAAERFLPGALELGSDVGLFTSSGKDHVDFTNDLGKLIKGLQELAPRSRLALHNQCPNLDPYEAYMVAERDDPWTTSLVVAETQVCLCRINLLSGGISASDAFRPRFLKMQPLGTGGPCPEALEYAQGQAKQLLAQVDMQSRFTLEGLENLVASIRSRDGEKTILFVSPGFLSLPLRYELNQVVEFALRAHVTISTLDARGVVPGGVEASQGADGGGQASLPTIQSGELAQLRQDNLNSSADSLATLASATGGVFYHGDNDFEKGFREAAAPATAYMLAFTPNELRPNGQFHDIRVELAAGARGTVEARRGYYAPSAALNAKTRAAGQIAQAVFSDGVLHEIPVICGAKVPQSGELEILTHLGINELDFRREHGRSVDSVTVVVALFHPSGEYATGREQTANMNLPDVELKKLRHTGVLFKSDLRVTPGEYKLRVVVRASRDGRMSALSRLVNVP